MMLLAMQLSTVDRLATAHFPTGPSTVRHPYHGYARYGAAFSYPPSPPITIGKWFFKQEDKSCFPLLPGCGNRTARLWPRYTAHILPVILATLHAPPCRPSGKGWMRRPVDALLLL